MFLCSYCISFASLPLGSKYMMNINLAEELSWWPNSLTAKAAWIFSDLYISEVLTCKFIITVHSGLERI